MKLSDWERLPPVGRLHIGCLCCTTAVRKASLELIINVGFGYSAIMKDDETVWEESLHARCNEDIKTVGDAEALAKDDPDHDWRVIRGGPMHGETFQRQDGAWICVKSNEGFA